MRVPRKSAANKRKHGVTFDEAQTVFYDEQALLIADPDHSTVEERFVLLGISAALRSLVVCHCYREDAEVIRIIFSKARRNPYARRLKRQITIRLDADTIRYFNALAEETGIPYQTLINLYLRECAASKKRLELAWRGA